jgi:enoyl-CoA hydratase
VADLLLVDVSGAVATVTLNRPEARNALNSALRSALFSEMRRLGDDDDIDVVILTGTDPAFCAGLDLKELGSGANVLRAGSQSDDDPSGRTPFPLLSKPVIGAINGGAITGGLEIVLNCDFLVASERACFADTHTRVGVQPDWGLSVLLPQAVGLRRAREMSATGNFVDAERALAWGLVNHVVSHDELLPTCRALAADIVSNDQVGLRRLLRTYSEGSLVSARDAWRIEEAAARDWLASGGGSTEEVDRRRAAIVDRGRRQTS